MATTPPAYLYTTDILDKSIFYDEKLVESAAFNISEQDTITLDRLNPEPGWFVIHANRNCQKFAFLINGRKVQETALAL